MRKNKVMIIAEAGVNHNGDLNLAMKLIDAAVNAGADVIKFQTFKASALVTKSAAKADYQKKETGNDSQLTMLKKLELSIEAHQVLQKYAASKKITFLSTPFDRESVVLLKKLKLKTGKIPSGEITNLPYLQLMAASFPKIILSTGMSTLNEVEAAVKVLYKSGTKREHLTILHCTTEYPASLENVNLNVLAALRKKFNTNIGYSDHTKGIEVAVAAVALGATLIEKHLTLDNNLDGPDHKASLEPQEFKMMVSMIRNLEIALGNDVKKPAPVEIKNRIAARKSIVASADIKKGETFTEMNITTKRPGNGMSPMLWNKVMGKKAARNYKKDDLIR